MRENNINYFKLSVNRWQNHPIWFLESEDPRVHWVYYHMREGMRGRYPKKPTVLSRARTMTADTPTDYKQACLDKWRSIPQFVMKSDDMFMWQAYYELRLFLMGSHPAKPQVCKKAEQLSSCHLGLSEKEVINYYSLVHTTDGSITLGPHQSPVTAQTARNREIRAAMGGKRVYDLTDMEVDLYNRRIQCQEKG